MLSRIKHFVNKYSGDIILAIGVFLISLLAFQIGYILAKDEVKCPLELEETQHE